MPMCSAYWSPGESVQKLKRGTAIGERQLGDGQFGIGYGVPRAQLIAFNYSPPIC